MTAATRTPLVPSPLRRPLMLTVLVAAAVFAFLAVRYAGTSTAGHVDNKVDSVVDPLGDAHQWLVDHAMMFGSPPWVVAMALVLSMLCLLLRRYRLAILALVGPGLTGLTTTVLKPALDRTIDGGYAFPSGHTGGATSLGLVAGLLLISLLQPGRVGALVILAVAAVGVGGGVGAAMVASDAHYPTDTLGGFCTAVVMVGGAALALDWLATVRGPSNLRTKS
ncbi:MAG TPA: phosphatase PAP2 family protein [Pseudonocardia sp.]